jgi:predicted phage tail protein
VKFHVDGKLGGSEMSGRYSWTIGLALILAGGGFFNGFGKTGSATSGFAMAIVMGGVGLIAGFVIDLIKNQKNR